MFVAKERQGWFDGGRGASRPQYFQICKTVGQKIARQAARGLVTIFSVTFLFSK